MYSRRLAMPVKKSVVAWRISSSSRALRLVASIITLTTRPIFPSSPGTALAEESSQMNVPSRRRNRFSMRYWETTPPISSLNISRLTAASAG